MTFLTCIQHIEGSRLGLDPGAHVLNRRTRKPDIENIQEKEEQREITRSAREPLGQDNHVAVSQEPPCGRTSAAKKKKTERKKQRAVGQEPEFLGG